MSETIMVRHVAVLHLTNQDYSLSHVRFSRPLDDETDRADGLWLPRQTWAEMGEPETVTLIVEPGDLLNDEAEADHE